MGLGVYSMPYGSNEGTVCDAALCTPCREVIVTNADKVHAINQLVGDHEMPTCWGFGKRRIKGASKKKKKGACHCSIRRRSMIVPRCDVWHPGVAA